MQSPGTLKSRLLLHLGVLCTVKLEQGGISIKLWAHGILFYYFSIIFKDKMPEVLEITWKIVLGNIV